MNAAEIVVGKGSRARSDASGRAVAGLRRPQKTSTTIARKHRYFQWNLGNQHERSSNQLRSRTSRPRVSQDADRSSDYRHPLNSRPSRNWLAFGSTWWGGHTGATPAHDAFIGLSIPEAAKKHLTAVRKK